MAEEFTIKSNDTSPKLLYELDLLPGQTLVGATVRFHMAEADGTVVVDAAGTVEDAAAQQIAYAWGVGDTASPGTYRAEFEVTFSDGSVETYPNSDYLKIIIKPDLA